MPKRKPKLTEEDKKRLKEEKLEAIKEGLRQAKRDRLTREVRYGELSRKKLQKRWIKMLTEENMPDLKIQIEYTANLCDLILDNKDFQISLLLDELDHAEEQYNINFRGHVSNIHAIFEAYKIRLNELKESYDEEYNNLVYVKQFETNKIDLLFDNANEYMKVMIYTLLEERKENDKTLRTEYLSKIKEEKNHSSNLLSEKVQDLEKIFEDIWQSFKKTLEDYSNDTVEVMKKCDILHKHDDFMRPIIKEQYNQLYVLHRQLYQLKEQQIKENDQIDKQIEFKKQDRDFCENIYNRLRNQFKEDFKFDNEKITELVIRSNNTIKELQRLENVCKSVVKMYAICEKFETQNEKVLPFPKAVPKIKSKSAPFIIIPDNIRLLKNFMMRHGQVSTVRHVLYEEREFLKRHNNTIIKSLLRYRNSES